MGIGMYVIAGNGEGGGGDKVPRPEAYLEKVLLICNIKTLNYLGFS